MISKALRRRALYSALALLAGGACGSPPDSVVESTPYTPVAQGNGLYRVTFGPGPAETRGFTADGRLVVRTRDVPPFGPQWVILGVPLDGGVVREELGIYRQALGDDMGAVAALGDRRVLSVWKRPAANSEIGWIQGCPDPAPPVPSVIAFTVFDLPADDGTPLRDLPTFSVDAGIVADRLVPGPVNTGTNVRVRVTPAARELRARGGNPFGPVLVPGGNDVIWSDGEAIWRASMADASRPRQLAAEGAYPALSADGSQLAYARPLGVDSTTEVFMVAVGLGLCIQEHVEITASGWETVVRELSSGDERVLGEGLEPAFDPVGARLVVRTNQLQWVDLATARRTDITPTAGAFAPAVSPDGAILAFTLRRDAATDVYFLRLSSAAR